MSRKYPSQLKNLNDTLDVMTLMTHVMLFSFIKIFFLQLFVDRTYFYYLCKRIRSGQTAPLSTRKKQTINTYFI